MKKVFEILGMDKPIDGDFGIEIEAEGRGMVAVTNQYWHTEADGSLRGHYPDGAAEFVLDKPIKLKNVRDAVETLQKALNKAELKFSFRTSVHVHTNVQDLTYEQLLNFIYTYLLLEEPLTTFCGKERKGNRFCLRLADAEGMLYTMNKMFKGTGREIGEINGEKVRYAAINLAALPKYGSLEFRAMRGNLDADTIDTWCSALYALREYAKSKGDPLAILEDYKANSPTSFLKAVLGPALSKSFLYPRIIKDIQRSFSLSLDLPHAFLAAQKEREAPKPKKKAGGDKFLVDDFMNMDVVPLPPEFKVPRADQPFQMFADAPVRPGRAARIGLRNAQHIQHIGRIQKFLQDAGR